MRTLVVSLVTGLFVVGLTSSADAGRKYHRTVSIYQSHFNHWCWDDDISFDLDDGSIIIKHDGRRRDRSTVEFTKDYELYIDGERIDLNEEQQLLVREFHEQGMDIVDQAKEIGWEGAKVGIEGAKLGLRAIGCLFKLLSPNYDADDMEEEIERAAEKIEAKAEILEEKAEVIEEMAEELEDIVDDLRDEIPELGRLRWF